MTLQRVTLAITALSMCCNSINSGHLGHYAAVMLLLLIIEIKYLHIYKFQTHCFGACVCGKALMVEGHEQ